ncbi:hypothetical protein RZS08_61915, partial [Arthrospira platensis SPKY1]|nr:hypothetical protein [Arthrospira platensis SPKY1]
MLDGELLVMHQGKIQPFRALQQRMGVKEPSNALLTDYPVSAIFYDLLVEEGQECVKWPLNERRQRLVAWSERLGFVVSEQYTYQGRDALEALFQQALSNGNEG